MSAVALALAAIRDLESVASDVTALAHLSKTSFDEKWREADQALVVLLAGLDDRPAQRLLEQRRRGLKRAAGIVSLHMAEPYRNPADRIRGWGDYWADLDAEIVELRHFLEDIGGSASTALGARHSPKTITIRLVVPDEDEEPPAPKRAGIG